MPETMIVTGASSGIGQALALAAASRGYRVVGVARRAERLDALHGAIRTVGGSCVTLAADVTARETPSRIVDLALRSFGRIDVVVNNAGGGAYGPLLEQSDAQLDAQWQLNVVAPLRLARAALPSVQVVRGVFVFFGSGSARIPLPEWGAYASAKAAIRAAAIQLRRELRPRGITVTYVDPGLVATEFHSAIGIERPRGIPPNDPDRIARAVLVGVARRRAVINATPLQTLGTVAGEFAGTLADPIIRAFFTPRRISNPNVATNSASFEALSSRAESLEALSSPAESLEALSSPAESLEALSSRAESLEALSSRAESRDETPSFESALEPVARRMERVKLPQSFLREALIADETLELNALAMRWAGMPNKNERAALREALETLASAGYLQPVEDEKWKVVRPAD